MVVEQFVFSDIISTHLNLILLKIDTPNVPSCQYLQEEITLTNCVEITNLARFFSLTEVDDYVKNFILKNFGSFLRQEEFLRLSVDDVCEILRFFEFYFFHFVHVPVPTIFAVKSSSSCFSLATSGSSMTIKIGFAMSNGS